MLIRGLFSERSSTTYQQLPGKFPQTYTILNLKLKKYGLKMDGAQPSHTFDTLITTKVNMLKTISLTQKLFMTILFAISRNNEVSSREWTMLAVSVKVGYLENY